MLLLAVPMDGSRTGTRNLGWTGLQVSFLGVQIMDASYSRPQLPWATSGGQKTNGCLHGLRTSRKGQWLCTSYHTSRGSSISHVHSATVTQSRCGNNAEVEVLLSEYDNEVTLYLPLFMGFHASSVGLLAMIMNTREFTSLAGITLTFFCLLLVCTLVNRVRRERDLAG